MAADSIEGRIATTSPRIDHKTENIVQPDVALGFVGERTDLLSDELFEAIVGVVPRRCGRTLGR